MVKGEDLQPRGRRFKFWRQILDGMLEKQAITIKKRNQGSTSKIIFFTQK